MHITLTKFAELRKIYVVSCGSTRREHHGIANISIKEIARNLEKSVSTISRKIRSHAKDVDKYAPYPEFDT